MWQNGNKKIIKKKQGKYQRFCQLFQDIIYLLGNYTKEELFDGVKIGGVEYYLGEAEESNVNLFI